MRIPRATYRLQLRNGVDFAAAARLAPYLAELGISDVYLSPVFQARPGTTHGYDITDPCRIEPELGGEEGLSALFRDFRAAGLGVLLDVVPNHMAADPASHYWRDVLARGRDAEFAPLFDVDWDPPFPSLRGKVLAPVLGCASGRAAARGELAVETRNGSTSLRYFERRFPLADASPQASLRSLLRSQHYRLCHWRAANRLLNYRRFFDISDLVGVRVEDDAVFSRTHSRILSLVRARGACGLRIDHVDGLADPGSYLRRLRGAAPDAYLVVEKILGSGETLPADWPVEGTTGYDFGAAVSALFVDAAGLDRLEADYDAFTGRRVSRAEACLRAKRQVLRELFGGERRALLARLAPHFPDAPAGALEHTLDAVVAALPVYRTYGGPSPFLERAFLEARARAPEVSDAVLDRLRDLLLSGGEGREIARRFEQLTGPVMAKGFEDTTLYRHAPLLALNEVGSDSQRLLPLRGRAAFFDWLAARKSRSPLGMNATSTHDSKRSEDVRARLFVLSELSGAYRERLVTWARHNEEKKIRVSGILAPDREEEAFLYQTLLGVWPLFREEEETLPDRLQAYVVKAAREAKRHTSWLFPDAAYEAALGAFLESLLDPDDSFLRSFRPFQERIARCGALNSLTQICVKSCAPGVPDFYQGSELWDFSLVDPDNRRPVDFARRAAELQALRLAAPEERTDALLATWRDGRIKLFVTASALALRREDPELFADGELLPAAVAGPRRRRVVAFARRRGDSWALCVCPRLCASLGDLDRPPLGAVWKETGVLLPSGAPHRWRDRFTGRELSASRGRLAAAEVFARFPVALLSAVG